MFTLKSLVSFASMAILSATAAPAVIPTEGALQSRQDYAWAKFCEHPEFTGECITLGVTNNICTILPDHFNDRASSVENLSRPSWSCTWYEHTSCTGQAYTNQRDAKLNDGSGFFDDRITSFKCIRVCGDASNPFC
ncbi:hypothetical protein V8F20_010649 [Naviculisporaceae sp. PSN 640]